LPRLANVVSTAEADGRLHLLTPDPDQLVRDLVTADVPFRDLEVRPTTLEEAFLQLTTA
jgi:ABC-2 type transport system ATP-binding protein